MSHSPEIHPEHLLTTEQQLDVLRQYNTEIWRDLSAEMLNAVPVDSQPQQPDALRVLHVADESPLKTILRWRPTFFRDYWSDAHWNAIPREDYYLAQHENTAEYAPGIHEVCVDLTSYDLDDFASQREAREAAAARGQLVTHGEMLSVLGLHQALRTEGGYAATHLPRLGGYKVRNPFNVSAEAQNDWSWTIGIGSWRSLGSGQRYFGLRVFSENQHTFSVMPVLTERK